MSHLCAVDPAGEHLTGLHRRALALSWFTVAYNLAEGAVAVVASVLAGSPALLGFGLDSFVEALSGGIMIWRFRTAARLCADCAEGRERRALGLVGLTFLVLGAYVAYECLSKLLRHEPPQPSALGLAITLVSLAVMIPLYRAKLRVARGLSSRSLEADARESIACVWLSVSVLLGLGLNFSLHWWWADPVAGLVIVGFLLREGWEALAGEKEEPSSPQEDDT